MAFVRLLGPLEYRTAAGEAVDLGHTRQRGIFAMLAVSANEAVMTTELIDWTWGSEPPLSARNVLHSYISRLRGALEAPGSPAEATVQRRHGGYVLEVDDDSVDLHRFRRTVARARSGEGDARASVGLFRQALGIWQDSPLGGVTGTWATTVRELLELERLSVLVECHERELRLGGHRELLDELRAVADRHPDNEIVIRNLMTALHRSGRRTEALGAYAALRRRLAENLGVDPAGETQELHTSILAAGGRAGAGRTLAGDPCPVAAARSGGPPEPRVPHQLPRATRLVGREQELAMLDGFVAAASAESSCIRVIEGPPGIGKTALAIHWAHRVAPRFPDGQIFVDLHGRDGARDFHDPDTLIRFILRSLGVPAPPAGTGDLTERYREAVAGRRLLIVLDDLACHDTAAGLLREVSDGTVVLATARSTETLRELEGSQSVRFVRLRELSNRQAERMLAGILGEARVEAEEDAVARIIELCGRTPQALTMVAEHALGRPHLSLVDLTMTMALEAERWRDRPVGEDEACPLRRRRPPRDRAADAAERRQPPAS
ncbi:BTAD domain-containing putative transcriptional regulator [Actinacidiphila sp. ITFR-21]|uniref:BTAD domain-containing putative transcriptional regulator n=1 Tax=Actinacidiphila sp. ITFR-21 TaxID=3075199 RepID=UPI002889E949|nr:BTAD domain-containing putative transcriptional regulator [Streptomyces sp. ITFR-21]WNI17987.1 BTAD domain-containing putative transcriptional regulator [Streptomyces sp. ITFR-21]